MDLKLVEFEKKVFKLMNFNSEYCYIFNRNSGLYKNTA
jgi:hypothetical protein